jgi:uncharacterized protein (TIGR02391 family)
VPPLKFSDAGTADELLGMEIEELAWLVLEFFRSRQDVHGTYDRTRFCKPVETAADFGSRQEEVGQAVIEAWMFLKSVGVLVPQANDQIVPVHGRMVVSRKGKKIDSKAAWDRFVNAQRLPENLLHPRLILTSYPNYVRGSYDSAVRDAMLAVEVGVRTSGGFAAGLIGVDLMVAAFRQGGPLRDASLLPAEADGIANLFKGAIGIWRNPVAHNFIPFDHVEAGQLLMAASRLLSIVQTTAAKNSLPPPF